MIFRGLRLAHDPVMDMLVRNIQHGLELVELSLVESAKMYGRERLHEKVEFAKSPPARAKRQLFSSGLDIAHARLWHAG